MKLSLCLQQVLCAVKYADFSCHLGDEGHAVPELRDPSAETASARPVAWSGDDQPALAVGQS